MPSGWVNDTRACRLGTQAFGKRLPRGISDAGIVLQTRFSRAITGSKVMKRTEEVCDQFGIIGDILKTADRFKLTRQMISDFSQRCLNGECAIPGTAVFIVETVSARPGICKCGIDECMPATPEDKFARIKLGKARLLRLKPAIGDAFQAGEIRKRAMIGGKR